MLIRESRRLGEKLLLFSIFFSSLLESFIKWRKLLCFFFEILKLFFYVSVFLVCLSVKKFFLPNRNNRIAANFTEDTSVNKLLYEQIFLLTVRTDSEMNDILTKKHFFFLLWKLKTVKKVESLSFFFCKLSNKFAI